MNEQIYIIGHKKPDLDSVVSAYAYKLYKQRLKGLNYIASVCDPVNPLTKWIFSYFKQEIPELIQSIENKKVILVDHTEPEQRPPGWQKAQIIEVIDHREPNLDGIKPEKIIIKKYGSVTTIIAQKYIQNKVEINSGLAGLMLSAILDDTLALNSPNTTLVDEIMVTEMATRAKIGDINAFSKKMFNKKDSWDSMPALQILQTDLKEMKANGHHISVTKIETMDSKNLEKRQAEFLLALNRLQKDNPITLRLLMIIDILSKSCILLGVGERVTDLEKIFNTKLIKNNKMYLPKITSRKTQIVPPILKYYSNE